MTCKECLYKPMCKYNQSYICDNFKDKSKYIELPCKIADTVYYPWEYNSITELVLLCIEKRTPKKPWSEDKYYGNGRCPSCGAMFLDKSTNFCGNCGQALDWSE